MDIKLYTFPTLKDGRIAVEEAYCELLNKYRKKENLTVEELDWMDSANNWLTAVGNKF